MKNRPSGLVSLQLVNANNALNIQRRRHSHMNAMALIAIISYIRGPIFH